MSKEKIVEQDKNNFILESNTVEEKVYTTDNQTMGLIAEDEVLLKEGYLMEIYFSLKSDNPAEW